MFRRLPSPAMIVAFVALSLALGGVSYAAVSLPKNSVGTPQLKKNAVTGNKVKDNSLTGRDIKEGTLKIPNVPGSVMLAGLDFLPRHNSTTYGYAGAGGVYAASGSDFFTADVNIPDGATITKVTFFFMDDNAANATGYLTSYESSTGDFVDHLSVSSSGVTGLGSAASGPVVVPVDNDRRNYRLLCGFGANASNLALQGARVDYTFKATLKSRPTTQLKAQRSE